MAWLTGEDGPATAGAQREAQPPASNEAVDPADLWALADQLPYQVELGWGRHSAEGAFDAVLVRRDHGRPAFVHWPEEKLRRAASANDPLRAAYTRHVVPQLRALLKENLPGDMQPAAIVVLSNLPLTPNGKIDRKSLPAPETAHRSIEQSFVEPRTALEQVLAGIWASVLGVERVGLHDNFFEMGGHSLLVIQVIVRIRDAFQLDLPFRSLFTTPTVAGLGEAMLGLAGQGERIERTAELLVALSQLSDNEVEAMLTRETAAPVGAP